MRRWASPPQSCRCGALTELRPSIRNRISRRCSRRGSTSRLGRAGVCWVRGGGVSPPSVSPPRARGGPADLAAFFRSFWQTPSRLGHVLKIVTDARRAWTSLDRGRRLLGDRLAFPGAAKPAPAAPVWLAPSAAAAPSRLDPHKLHLEKRRPPRDRPPAHPPSPQPTPPPMR